MNRTIKDATVKRFYYETHTELRAHLADFVSAYNFAKRLKTLKGLTPYEYICKAWTKEPERFTLNPLQQMPGLNNLEVALRRFRNWQATLPNNGLSWSHAAPVFPQPILCRQIPPRASQKPKRDAGLGHNRSKSNRRRNRPHPRL